MFVLKKWKEMYHRAIADKKMYEKMWQEEQKRSAKLKGKLLDMETSFKRIHPRMLEEEYIEISLDLFNKYCKGHRQVDTLKDGRPVYYYTPEKSSYSKKVVPTESLPDGYIRYVVNYEEPNKICVHCKKHFVIADGYPNKNAQFCDERCFNNHIWKQEMLTKKEKEEK